MAYPQLIGMADEAVQKKINDDIVRSSGVANHLVTLATLGDSLWGLKVDCLLYTSNASERARAAARYSTLSNDEDGVAHAIRRYALSGSPVGEMRCV